jgi:hypothetical protein
LTTFTLVLTLPLIVPLFLGDLLSAPFVARRNESGFHWLLFLLTRTVVPVAIIGAIVGCLIAHWRK